MSAHRLIYRILIKKIKNLVLCKTIIMSVILSLSTLSFLPMRAWANSIQQSYIYEHQKKYEKARQLMVKLVQEKPMHYLAHLRAGYLSYMSGKLSSSVYYYHKAIALHPKAIEPRLGLLLPLLSLGQYRKAQITAQAVLRLDPKNYTGRSKLAYSLYMAGDYRQAAKYYQSVISDYPSDGSMFLGLAWSYCKMNRKTIAHKYFQKALTILPKNKNAQQGLKYCR